MKQTVLLIDHTVGQRDDRASAQLEEMGYALEWRSPARGDALPSLDEGHVAVITYGGAESVNDGATKPYIREEIDWIARWVDSGRPYLGICLGSQLLASALGAKVNRHAEGFHQIGYVEIAPTTTAKGFMDAPMHVYHWHNEGFEVPASAELLATGPEFPNQAFRYGSNAYGIQFHPEVSPAIMHRWLEEAGYMLVEPGAHTRETQIADSARFDAPMAAWFRRFLNDWLA